MSVSLSDFLIKVTRKKSWLNFNEMFASRGLWTTKTVDEIVGFGLDLDLDVFSFCLTLQTMAFHIGTC